MVPDADAGSLRIETMEKLAAKCETHSELHEEWDDLDDEERIERFKQLPPADAEEFFREIGSEDEARLIAELPEREQRLWIRVLDPDDVADLIQELPENKREGVLGLLDATTHFEVTALLAYKEDVAGGLMSPRYARIRSDMTVQESLAYLRHQAMEQLETIYYVYVLDPEQRLLGQVSLRKLLAAAPDRRIEEVMRKSLITVQEDSDQEEISRVFAEHNLMAIPVVDSENRMKGIVTVDDIVDVVEEEATEDIQKMGGTEALQQKYLQINLWLMLRKRAGWLMILFVGEMLTASAMGYFEKEIANAVVLALFLPLIISSGGNAGSQASTLVIRAMALDEVRLRDWFRVLRREFVTGSGLGLLLGTIGLLRILIWQGVFHSYGEHYILVALTVMGSVIGVVLWGSLVGSILPFVLRAAKFDPASASTPFVATLVDVTGVIIYFEVARCILKGTLL
ncbi:MAG TPA: magnesium transporter [Oculatellaceae cyanobacterium]